MIERSIPRSDAGIRAVLREMKELANAPFAAVVEPRAIHAFLAEHWDYEFQPLAGQILRTVPRMLHELNTRGKITGACADAAILAGAILYSDRRRRPELVKSAWFAAVRPPQSVTFDHVCTMAIDRADVPWRIDPTAPADADYTNWEVMELPLF